MDLKEEKNNGSVMVDNFYIDAKSGKLIANLFVDKDNSGCYIKEKWETDIALYHPESRFGEYVLAISNAIAKCYKEK